MSEPASADVTQPTSASGGPLSHAIFRVARLHKLVARQLLREIGLYPGQEMVMMQLWDGGPQRQVDLIRMTDSDAATMTRTVRRLEKSGFVHLSPSHDDRRAVIVEATAASRPMQHEVARIWNELESLTVGELSPQVRADTLRNLEALESNLLKITGTSPEEASHQQ